MENAMTWENSLIMTVTKTFNIAWVQMLTGLMDYTRVPPVTHLHVGHLHWPDILIQKNLRLCIYWYNWAVKGLGPCLRLASHCSLAVHKLFFFYEFLYLNHWTTVPLLCTCVPVYFMYLTSRIYWNASSLNVSYNLSSFICKLNNRDPLVCQVRFFNEI